MVEFSTEYLNGRIEQLRREREQIRLVEIAMAVRIRRRGPMARVLAGVGQRLITFGTSLHQRYADSLAEDLITTRLDHSVQPQSGS